jgi:hypothetical protein
MWRERIIFIYVYIHAIIIIIIITEFLFIYLCANLTAPEANYKVSRRT